MVLSRSLQKVKWDRTQMVLLCLHLAEVVLLPGPPVFVARKPWDLCRSLFCKTD